MCQDLTFFFYKFPPQSVYLARWGLYIKPKSRLTNKNIKPAPLLRKPCRIYFKYECTMLPSNVHYKFSENNTIFMESRPALPSETKLAEKEIKKVSLFK